MATYVNDLRLKEIATGDESGTWGTSTNTNLELTDSLLLLHTNTLMGSIKINNIRNTDVLTVTAQRPNPDEAALIVNTII